MGTVSNNIAATATQGSFGTNVIAKNRKKDSATTTPVELTKASPKQSSDSVNFTSTQLMTLPNGAMIMLPSADLIAATAKAGPGPKAKVIEMAANMQDAISGAPELEYQKSGEAIQQQQIAS